MATLTFMQAIGREEGFGLPNSRATRNNNPGNLNFEPWTATKFGAVLETIPPGVNECARFAHFPTPEAGWGAMRALLLESYLNLEVSAALNKWAPPSDGNDTSAYTDAVCKWCGVEPTTILTAELIG